MIGSWDNELKVVTIRWGHPNLTLSRKLFKLSFYDLYENAPRDKFRGMCPDNVIIIGKRDTANFRYEMPIKLNSQEDGWLYKPQEYFNPIITYYSLFILDDGVKRGLMTV